ncbi:MAG: hypothetical protein JNK15_23225 [Planctomycetes bacterium]|nr:hypothetical protein [Planctomycetota bacterium]
MRRRFVAAAATMLAAQVPSQIPTNYQSLTNPFSVATNFNVETVRGLVFDATGAQVWALNTHGSMLARLTLPNGVPTRQLFRTLDNPVALAMASSGGTNFVLVLGGGTHGLCAHNAVTGEIVAYLDLPGEPADIVVDDQQQLAFVSCTDVNEVVSVSLANLATGQLTIFKHIGVDGSRPTFLSFWEGLSSAPNDNVVWVAPLLSGNDTTHDNQPYLHVVRGAGLPDDDLFEISTSTLAITSKLKRAGTLLTAHGRNPATGRHWVVGTESFNELPSEPANKGQFAKNRLVIAPLGSSPYVVTDPDIVALDGSTALLQPANSPGQPSANKPLAFPFGLSFRSDGIAAVAGSASDTVRILSSSGATLKNVGLPAGSIPRQVLFSPDGLTLWVHCWGTNRVLGFDFNALLSQATTTPVATWDLGPDPQPKAVQRGRATWYDADNSLHKSLTCNHCHPRGGMDLLGWQLADLPFDHKETMVTQSLLSIEDTFPYHWRGERNLGEFNDAFSGLLGGTNLDATAREDFEAFVFSLQAPANPRQQESRNLTGTTTSGALAGQAAFHTTAPTIVAFPSATCASCHGAESGSNGQITQDNATSAVPSNTNLDVAHLRQLQAKLTQSTVTASVNGVSVTRPRGGFGLSHNGDNLSVAHFLSPPTFVPGLPVANIAALVAEFDQGIAPRVHRAVLMRGSNTARAAQAAIIQANFIPQAQGSDPWLEIAVVGQTNGVARNLFFRPTNNDFVDEFGVSATLSALTSQSAQGSLLFVMLAPGNARRFAVDPDNDGLDTAGEASAGTDPMRFSSDNDEFPDGYEVTVGGNVLAQTTTTLTQLAQNDGQAPNLIGASLDHVTGRLARFRVTFDEPTRTDVQVERLVPGTNTFAAFGPLQVSPEFETTGTLVAQEMKASYPLGGAEQFRIRITMRDHAGNSRTRLLGLGGGPTPITVTTDSTVLTSGPLVPNIVTAPLVLTHTQGQPVTIQVNLSNQWNGLVPFDLTPMLWAVAQVSILTPTGWTVVAPSPIASATDTTLTGPASALGSWGNEITGPMLVSEESVSNGPGSNTSTATFRFAMPPGTALGTKIRFALTGISWVRPVQTTPGNTNTLLFGPAVTTSWWLLPLSPAAGRLVEFKF